MCVLYCMYLPAVFCIIFVIECVQELKSRKRAPAPLEDDLKFKQIHKLEPTLEYITLVHTQI